jgi:hypothetical protein
MAVLLGQGKLLFYLNLLTMFAWVRSPQSFLMPKREFLPLLRFSRCNHQGFGLEVIVGWAMPTLQLLMLLSTGFSRVGIAHRIEVGNAHPTIFNAFINRI